MASNKALVHGMLSCIKGSRVLSLCEETSYLLKYTADGRSANYLPEVFSFDNPIQVNESISGESLDSNTTVVSCIVCLHIIAITLAA